MIQILANIHELPEPIRATTKAEIKKKMAKHRRWMKAYITCSNRDEGWMLHNCIKLSEEITRDREFLATLQGKGGMP